MLPLENVDEPRQDFAVFLYASTKYSLLTVTYPHMPIGKVWIYWLWFVCLFVCLYGYGFLRRG